MEKILWLIKELVIFVLFFVVGLFIGEQIKQNQMIKDCEKDGKPCIISAIPMVTGL